MKHNNFIFVGGKEAKHNYLYRQNKLVNVSVSIHGWSTKNWFKNRFKGWRKKAEVKAEAKVGAKTEAKQEKKDFEKKDSDKKETGKKTPEEKQQDEMAVLLEMSQISMWIDSYWWFFIFWLLQTNKYSEWVVSIGDVMPIIRPKRNVGKSTQKPKGSGKVPKANQSNAFYANIKKKRK